MFGKYFFIFVFKNLFLRIKSKGNFFFFQNQKHDWLLERIKQFFHNKEEGYIWLYIFINYDFFGRFMIATCQQLANVL